MSQRMKSLSSEVLSQPLYSPDVGSTDFHLFKHTSTFLDGNVFKDSDNIKSSIKEFLNPKYQAPYEINK